MEIPSEFRFVESIAKSYAVNQDELTDFCLVGVKAAERYKQQTLHDTKDIYLRFSGWVVKQAIMKRIIEIGGQDRFHWSKPSQQQVNT